MRYNRTKERWNNKTIAYHRMKRDILRYMCNKIIIRHAIDTLIHTYHSILWLQHDLISTNTLQNKYSTYTYILHVRKKNTNSPCWTTWGKGTCCSVMCCSALSWEVATLRNQCLRRLGFHWRIIKKYEILLDTPWQFHMPNEITTPIVNLVNLKSPQSICSCYCFLIPAPGPRTYNYNQLQYLRLDLCLAPAHGISLGKSEATSQLWLMLVMLPNMKTRSVLLQKLYIDIKYVRLITKPDLLFAASLFRNLHGVLAARHVAAWTMGNCDWWEMNLPSTPAGTNHA